MAEIDCNKNVLQKISKKSPDGKNVNATIYSNFNVDQLIFCTPLTRDKSETHASSAVFKGMSVVFSRTEIEKNLHQYELSFGGGNKAKRKRVVMMFERQLGNVDGFVSFEPRFFKDIEGKIHAYFWDVQIN